ncbi:MAG: uroporphyrinogen-III C-methyltransferase [Chloroflexi bacterium]|nr:uroporphyrinogen-III C-methyltransferase [Chloroflexota bacterium]
MKKGRVYIVGAGPGDPGLITVKGLECLAAADVVVYDRLADERLLSKARPDAELVYCGKSSEGHVLEQDEINVLCVVRAREGKDVVRLKGGDPFVFGRGGEEAEALAEAGIPFEVVPGVTSATAVPAYAGIPVTQRGLSSSVAVITGHEDPSKGESMVDWERLSRGAGTLVILMGVHNIAQIVEQLVRHGRPPQTPIALIRWGTLPRQETLVGTLADIVEKTASAGFGPPAVAVIGEVVRLRERLRWFDNQPLFGKKVLVTRSRKQASALSALLARHGAEPVELPTIEIEKVEYALEKVLPDLSKYQWVIFTSANAPEVFFNILLARNLDTRALGSTRICAIGPATAEAVERHGLKVDLVPREYVSEGILESLGAERISGASFLLPRAEEARDTLPKGLRKLGATVDEIPLYKTVPPRKYPNSALKMLLQGEVDIVTFTSSSTVHNLATLLGNRPDALTESCIACIGPVTEAAARGLGIRVDVVASEHTIQGLVNALVERFTLNKEVSHG